MSFKKVTPNESDVERPGPMQLTVHCSYRKNKRAQSSHPSRKTGSIAFYYIQRMTEKLHDREKYISKGFGSCEWFSQ